MPRKSLDSGISSRVENEASDRMAASRFYRASECARLAGVSTDTLRYYERQHLLPAPPRAANGYRRYPCEALSRVRVIRSALAVGFSVEELGQLLRARDRGLAPCEKVRQLAANKVEALDVRIRELQQLDRALSETIINWDKKLAKAPAGTKAGLLDSLATADPRATQLSPLLAPALRRKLSARMKESKPAPPRL